MNARVFPWSPFFSYYQNHRRYVKSFVANQLRGDALPVSQLGDCDPIVASETNPNIPVYPCGLIANSLFNGRRAAVVGTRGRHAVRSTATTRRYHIWVARRR